MLSRSILALVCWCAACLSASAAPKNVVLVVADDLGLTLGCYGNKTIKTPNIDAVAADGALFTHAYCTTASCSPSRSVILTGMFNHANGQYGLLHAPHHFTTFDNVLSLPARLRDAGYRTARVGKFHVAPEEVYPFEHVLKGDARNGVEMAEACRELIAEKGSRPLFLYFCTADPHRSRQFAKTGAKPNLFGNESTHADIEERTYDPAEVSVPPFLVDTPACRAELAQYYQSVSRVDQGVGRLIDILKQTGHWDDTLLVVVSDNGVPFPGAKTTAYDAGLNLPCIVRNPYCGKRGVRSDAMISWVDLAPTILEFASVQANRNKLHGRSFLSVLDHPAEPGWDEIYASHTFHEVTMYYPMRIVRTRKFKLIWNLAHQLPFPFASDLYRSSTWQDMLARGPEARYGKRTVSQYVNRPCFELYDIELDPDETNNLAGESRHAKTLSEMQGKLKAFQERTGDPWLHKWEYE